MDFVIAAAQSASEAGDVARNIQCHLSFSRIAADFGARLIVFPELSLTGYELESARSCAIALDSPVLDPLRHLASETRMTIMAGAPVSDGASGLLLAALILSPGGGVAVYSKQYVHAFLAGWFRRGGVVFGTRPARRWRRVPVMTRLCWWRDARGGDGQAPWSG